MVFIKKMTLNHLAGYSELSYKM